MNHIYKTVWNTVKGLWVCVSEATRSHTRSCHSNDQTTLERVSGLPRRFQTKRLMLAMLMGLVGMAPAYANLQFFNYGLTLEDRSDVKERLEVPWYLDGYVFPDLSIVNSWGSLDSASTAAAFQATHGTVYLPATRLTGVGIGGMDYALILDPTARGSSSGPVSLSLRNTLVEGDISVNGANLGINPDFDTWSQKTSLHGKVFLNGANVGLYERLGNVFRSEEDSEETTPLSVSFHSLGGSNSLQLAGMDLTMNTNYRLDLDALSKVAGNGRETQAFSTIFSTNNLDLVNATALGAIGMITVYPYQGLPSFHSVTSGEDLSTLTLAVNGVVRFNQGETVDLTLQYDQLSATSLFFDRNAVILGSDFGDFLKNDGEASFFHTIALKDPQALFSDIKPYWLTGKDPNKLTLALLKDTTLTAKQVNSIGGIAVRRGTTTLSGAITKPVMAEIGTTVILEPETQVNWLGMNYGSLVLKGGSFDLSHLDGLLARLTLMDAPVTLQGTSSAMVMRLITNASNLSTLRSQLDRLSPQTVELHGNFSGSIPEELISNHSWTFTQSIQVQGLPSVVSVAPGAEVRFSIPGSLPDRHELTNQGTVTYEQSLFPTKSRFVLGPGATVSFTNGATLTVPDHLPDRSTETEETSSALFSVDQLNQIQLDNSVQFRTESQPSGFTATAPNNVGLLYLKTRSLGTQPSWWTTDFMNNHSVDVGILSTETLTNDEVGWLNLAGVAPRELYVAKATLNTLLANNTSKVNVNFLTLTGNAFLTHPLEVSNSLTLNEGVTLGVGNTLTWHPGSRLVLGEGSTIALQEEGSIAFSGRDFGQGHHFVVSLPGETINTASDITPFLSREQKSFTAIETRNDLTDVNVDSLKGYAGWIIKGKVSSVRSAEEEPQIGRFSDSSIDGRWDRSDGMGQLIVPVEVAPSGSLSAKWLTPYSQVDVYGTVSSDYLMIADPTVGPATRPASAVTVHAGGTLEVKKQAYFSVSDSTSLNILTDGLLRADKEALIQSGLVIANAQYNERTSLLTHQSGTWEPSFDSENRYDLTDDTGYELTQRFEKIVVTSPSSVTVSQAQTAAYSVAGTLVAKDGTTFENAVDVAGTLSLEGAVSFANANADTPWLTTLTLHPTSTLTLAEGATLTLGGSSLVTDAPVLASTDGAPSWWSTVQIALGHTPEATLVTTAATSAVDASAFKRWEVRGVGDNIAQALPEETLIYAGKSLTLTMPQLDSGVIKNLGTVKFDAITLNNQAESRIIGGGDVEKVGSGTAIVEGAAQYAGHTTVQEGTLQLRRGASLTGNLTVKPRAVLYASLESPTTMATARRLARSVTSTADLTPTSSSNSLTFDDGSIFRVDALSETNYTRHSVVANVDIGAGVKLEVNIGSELESLAPETVLSNVLTWGEGLYGRFVGANNPDNIENLAYEVIENDKLDLQAIYDPEAKAMHLKVVANHEHLAPVEPTPDNPDNPDTPDTPSTDTPDTPSIETPTVPVRAGEEPLLSGTTKVVLAEFVHEAQRGLFDHERQCEDTTPTLWASLIGGRGKYANDGNVSGFSSEHMGVAAGTEVCRDKTRVGVMLAGAHSKADSTLNRVKHESKSDAWYVSLYGEQALNDTFTLTGHLGAGKSHLKGSRLFRDEGVSADSRTRATLYSAGLGLEAKVTDWVEPFVRLDYTRVSMRGFTETGANEHNQHVARDTYDELIARVGATLSGPLSAKWSWQARASVGVDLLDGVGTTHARFVDGSGVIATKNDSMSRVLGDVAVGLNYQVTSSWELNASLAGQVRKHYREGAVELRSVWTF